ncbi:MAG: alpha-amylase [Saprospiraceae bacterium]|nr:alpha-amylase [Saprospiraceae bacterium]
MRTLITLVLLTIFTSACQNEKKHNMEQTPRTFQMPEWAKNAVIYEVNIRQFTPEGTINALSDHIPRLKALGVDILWLMPVFPISETKRKGSLGSYYAVSDFKSVNPEFGTIEDLKNLIDKIHAYKMKVIFDWVPNHTGWDHTWIKSNPDFYTKGPDGQITDPLDPNTGQPYGWSDVADLNYNNPEMRKAMISDLLHWVNNYKIDGYRMDIAFGVPLDFWKTCADTLMDANPELFLLAEAEMPEQLNENTFHACYGWSFFHTMNAVAKGEKNVSHIRHWLETERPKFKKGSIMHFITNHDENSWNGTEFERMGQGYRAFAILAMTFDGIPLIYSGQEEPLTKRLKFFEKDTIPFEKFSNSDFYSTLNALKHQEEAMWNEPYGAPMQLIGKSDHILAYKREKNNSKVVIMLNLSDQKRKITLDEGFEGMLDIYRRIDVGFVQGAEVEMLPWESWVMIKK